MEETAMRSFLAKIAATLAAVAFAATISAGAFAASEFEGKWQVKDTKGNPFEITLSPDGTAKGNRADEGLNGTWKAVGNAVLITWDSEWTTRITKEGNTFKKMALQNGKPVGQPTEAIKVQ
jgi:hypothetical protein